MQTGKLENQKKKRSKRIGRGPGSGHGKTSGRGHNGQRSRSGFKSRAWFEGGQMPLQRRIPKRGFKSLNPKKYQIVNVSDLNRFDDGDVVTVEKLLLMNLIESITEPVKVLGYSNPNEERLNKKLTVKVSKVSKSAEETIKSLGGQVDILKKDELASKDRNKNFKTINKYSNKKYINKYSRLDIEKLNELKKLLHSMDGVE